MIEGIARTATKPSSPRNVSPPIASTRLRPTQLSITLTPGPSWMITLSESGYNAVRIDYWRFPMPRRRFWIWALSSALVVPAFTQEFRASISGQVTDPSGAPIQGAKVIVANLERNTTTEASTNSTGRYLAQFLYPGSYSVSIEHPGFKPYTQRGITLQAGRPHRCRCSPRNRSPVRARYGDGRSAAA
jgi:hypothetical protein